MRNKRFVVLLALAGSIVSNLSKAQVNTFPASGNVGIGTSSPGYPLDVIGGVRLNNTVLSSSNAPFANSSVMFSQLGFNNIFGVDGSWNTKYFGMKTNGDFIVVGRNIGLGTSTPGYPLDVIGGVRLNNTVLTSSNAPFASSSVMYSQLGFNNMFGVDGAWSTKYFGMKTNGDFIVTGGNVGIGTTTPNSLLAVNGNIRAREVKVENGNWPDFVFTESYNLPTLLETEKHIKEKGHLPGIPTADEVKNNGVFLGDMNAKLLQKIEEMTLYLIQLNKVIEAQGRTLENQQLELNRLKLKN